MPALSRPTLFALTTLSVLLTTGCQNSPSLITTTETKKDIAALVTDDVYKRSYVPVLLAREDVLTEGTQAQIKNNNDVYWCQYQDKRPEGFDVAICAMPR